jgi:hypothetical protein
VGAGRHTHAERRAKVKAPMPRCRIQQQTQVSIVIDCSRLRRDCGFGCDAVRISIVSYPGQSSFVD